MSVDPRSDLSTELAWAEDLHDPRVRTLRAESVAAGDEIAGAVEEQLPDLDRWLHEALDVGESGGSVSAQGTTITVELASSDRLVTSAVLRADVAGREPRRIALDDLLEGAGPASTLVGWEADPTCSVVGFVTRPPGSRLDTLHLWRVLDDQVTEAGRLYRSPVAFCPCGHHVVCFTTSGDEDAGAVTDPHLVRVDIDDASVNEILWPGLGPGHTYGLTSFTGRRVLVSSRLADEPVNRLWLLDLDDRCDREALVELPRPPALAVAVLDEHGAPVLRCASAADHEIAVLAASADRWEARPRVPGDGRLVGLALHRDRLLTVRATVDGSQVALTSWHSPDRLLRSVALDGLDVKVRSFGTDSVTVTATGWTVPTTVTTVPFGDVLDHLTSLVSSDARVSSQVGRQTSSDGTEVRYVDLSGPATGPGAATIIWVYGGFGVAPRPRFSPFVQTWLRCGGRMVIPMVRGGAAGTPGAEWAEAGRGTGKLLACEDVAAVARRLVADGSSDPRRLVVQGGSHGGFLAALTALRHPELALGFVANSAPLDLVALDRLSQGQRWAAEFGDRATRVLLSPLEAVRDVVPPPRSLLVFRLDDRTVLPANSTKYLAALRTTADQVVPTVEHDAGGHDARGARGQRHHELMRILGFAWTTRGEPEPH